MKNFAITAKEKSHLRELAKKQLEYANLPIMKERKLNWYDLKGDKPIVTFEMWTCEKDLLPPLQCKSKIAREIEHKLLTEIVNYELINDDNVVPDFYGISWHCGMLLFDTPIDRDHAQDSKGMNVGHHFKHPITDLKDDIALISKPSRFNINKEYSLKFIN